MTLNGHRTKTECSACKKDFHFPVKEEVDNLCTKHMFALMLAVLLAGDEDMQTFIFNAESKFREGGHVGKTKGIIGGKGGERV